jgi:hypothetical protein
MKQHSGTGRIFLTPDRARKNRSVVLVVAKCSSNFQIYGPRELSLDRHTIRSEIEPTGLKVNKCLEKTTKMLLK